MLAAEPRRELQEAVLAMLGPQPARFDRRTTRRRTSRTALIVWSAVGIPLTTSAVWAGAAIMGMLAN